ncbi:MAG: 50S ribosomal protein L33 [Gammaproteobacteria bacterium RIFCSPHIGHO2_12_FULL_43_28]|nr:MAG: 50S ribosomal protein L33 [Gammaproteobacteria bacterium RIFCSPHIGHO2_12_FULL_43_28]
MRDKIKMVSTGKTKAGKKTGTFRTTTKNKKKTTEKLALKSYDPRAYNPETGKNGMHVLFEEGKI